VILSILSEEANPPPLQVAIPLFPHHLRTLTSASHFSITRPLLLFRIIIPCTLFFYYFSFPSSSPFSLRFSWRVDLRESLEERRNNADFLEVFRMYELQRFATFVLQQIQFTYYHPWSICHTARDVESQMSTRICAITSSPVMQFSAGTSQSIQSVIDVSSVNQGRGQNILSTCHGDRVR